jgi:hypothetical protein
MRSKRKRTKKEPYTPSKTRKIQENYEGYILCINSNSELCRQIKINLFTYFCNLVKEEIEKTYGPRTSEKLTEKLLQKEYQILQNELKINLASGKIYTPKVWANRTKADIQKITDAIKIYLGENKIKMFSRMSVEELVIKSKAKEDKIKGDKEEDPTKFSSDVVKRLTELYNSYQAPNIYPKRNMRYIYIYKI